MRNKRIIAASAMVAAVGLTVTACGSSSKSTGGSGGTGGTTSSGGFNAAATSTVNPSTSTTGNVVLEDSNGLASADPGNTYDATDWNVSRLWARTALEFAQKPGAGSEAIVGDLATGPGQHNADNTQWTYTFNTNAKFANGDAVTTEDIAYAIARAGGWGATLSQSAHYFSAYVQNTGSNAKQVGSLETTAAQVPNLIPNGITYTANTITFKLTQPVSDFDYDMTLPSTAPFDINKPDNGTNYQNSIQSDGSSTGGYQVQSYTAGKQMVLVPNTNYVAASDPNGLHKVHASQITIKFGVDQATIDQDILHGRAQADIGGTGVATADQGIVLNNPKNKAIADDTVSGFMDYLALNTQIEPLNNIDCRIAIEYAINKTTVQSVMGGSEGAGQIATTIIPPTVAGYQQADVYQTPGESGDQSKAAQYFTKCKSEEGSKFNPTFDISAYSDQKKTVDGSNTISQELNSLGFQTSVKSNTLSSNPQNVGNFAWDQQNRVLAYHTLWGPDYPDGTGYLLNMVGSSGVALTGGATNLSYWSDSTFDSMMKKALTISDPTQRNAEYAAADKYAMDQAILVPLQYNTTLEIHSSNATNVTFSEAYGMYDFSTIGVSS